MEMELYYTLNAESDTPVMLIDRHIGGWDDEYGMGVDGAAFARELFYLDGMGKKCIEVWINSVGGNVMDGMNIYNAIVSSKSKVNTYNFGVCASIAGVIFQAGRNRVMADYALQMLHNTSGAGDSMDVFAMFNNSVATMISSRSKGKKTTEDILAIMDKTTWYNASQSLEEGLCDEISDSAKLNTKRTVLTTDGDIKNNWKQAAAIMNSAISDLKPVKTISNMSNYAAIANTLGLNSEASGEAIAKEIQSLKNIAEVAKSTISAKDTEIMNLTNTLATVRKENVDTISAKDAEIEQVKNQAIADVQAIKDEVKADRDLLARLKTEQEEATEAAKMAEIKNMVAGYAKSGRITNNVETCDKWEKMALAQGIDEVKDLLEAIPLNKKAPAIQVSNVGNIGSSVTAAEMVANMRKERSKN